MSEPTKPNFMRYQRVAAIISSEPALKTRLGTKTETVLKPNGDRVEFPKQAVELTERIHAAGHDANTLNKPQILKYAVDVIIRGDDSELPPAPPREEAVAPVPPAAEEPKLKKRVVVAAKVKKPRKKKEAAPAVVAPVAPAPEPVVEKPAEKPAPKPKPATPESNVRQITVSSPPQQSINSSVPFAVGCAVNSNLMAASQLLEIHDRTPEGKEIRVRLDKIIDEVLRRTTIPSNGQLRA